MARASVTSAILLSSFVLAAPRPAAAEVIAITRGTFVYENDIGVLDIAGTRGFRMNGRIPRHEGQFGAIDFCAFSEECTPGAVVQIAAGWGGSALQGTVAKLRGVTYSDIGGPNSPSGGLVEFSGGITMPEWTGGATTVTAPFEFGGLFVYGDEQSTQSAMLTGGGVATFFLEPGVGGSWVIRRAEFEFRPARR
jgi:hypothetical protein